MIKHVVLLTWKDGVTQEQVNEVTSAFEELAKDVEEIVSFSFGQEAEQGERFR